MLAKEFIKPIVNRKLLTRIFSKIEVSKINFYKGVPCWEWTAYINKRTGYGTVKCSGRNQPAHRAIYQIFVDVIPVHLESDHLCRNRKCVNPVHIEPVTPLENQLRGISIVGHNARKTHCSQGHEFTNESTLRYAKGGTVRNCRQCWLKSNASYRERQRTKKELNKGLPVPVNEQCIVASCITPKFCKQMCTKHYQQQKVGKPLIFKEPLTSL